jgi:cytochrome c peroxidase
MKKLYCIIFLGAFVLVMVQTAFVPPKPNTREELGKLLFFDPILSGNRTISCASCHKEEFAFADTVGLSPGVRGRKGLRNTPSAMNGRTQSSFFWDGRAKTLEQQALIPISNPLEMDLPIAAAVKRLNHNARYRKAFQRLFHEAPTRTNLAIALAAFERSLETSDSPFDDWRLNENEEAVNASAKRGYTLFKGKAKCLQCHFGADFNSNEFRNIGLFDGRTLTDSGRAAITKNPADLGSFKIGPLRNVALTSPYMHNGMFKTLRQVIEYYDDPDKVVPHAVGRDTLLLKPLNLSDQEKKDLESFLVSLTDKRFKEK